MNINSAERQITKVARKCVPSLRLSNRPRTPVTLTHYPHHASESRHFRTYLSLWPYLAPVEISWWYLKPLKRYHVCKPTNKRTHTQMDTAENDQLCYAITVWVERLTANCSDSDVFQTAALPRLAHAATRHWWTSSIWDHCAVVHQVPSNRSTVDPYFAGTGALSLRVCTEPSAGRPAGRSAAGVW